MRRAAVHPDRTHRSLPRGLVLQVLSRTSGDIVVGVVVVPVGQRHEVVRLVVHKRIVSLGKGVGRHLETVADALVGAVRHQAWHRNLHHLIKAVVHQLIDVIG